MHHLAIDLCFQWPLFILFAFCAFIPLVLLLCTIFIFTCTELPSQMRFFGSGDSAESWGFGGTGKKSTARKYLDYGTSFGEGDVIGVGIDLDNLSLSFKKNNEYLGAAFQLPAIVRETGLFPHIYVKNFDFEVNFRQSTKWFEPPGSEFRFVGDLKQEVGCICLH